MPNAATLALLLPLALSAQVTTTLSPRTTAAFDAYLRTAEPQMTGKPRYPELQANELRVEPVKAEGSFEVDGGLIHDWAAGLLVPNATPEQALAVLQNYAAYKSMYPPEIVDSRVLSHSGDRWRVYLDRKSTRLNSSH